MSVKWSVLRFICVCLTALVSVTFIGYQSLLPILEHENIFSSLCEENESLPCKKQSLRLDLMYTVSVSASYISYLFFSIICLKYGTKISLFIGGSLQTVSCIIFSFGSDWLCFLSYIVMAIGSAGIILSIIGVPNQYSPKFQGILYSILIGCIDASSGITYIFLLLYKHLSISMQILYISLAICIFITLLLSQFLIFSPYFRRNTTRYNTVDVELNFPSKKHHQKQVVVASNNDNNDNKEPLIDDNINEDSFNLYASISSEEMVNFYNIHFNSTWTDSFWSTQFVSILIWSMFYMTTIYFYMTTLDKQLKWITNDEAKDVLFGQQLFSIMLLLSGCCTIITGPIIDAFGMKLALIMMGIISIITSICSVIEMYNLQLMVTMSGIILNRFFYFTMAPLLIVTIFGAVRQQFVYGIVLFLSACFNLTGTLFDYLTQNLLNGDYMMINLITGISCFSATIWLLFTLRNNPLIT